MAVGDQPGDAGAHGGGVARGDELGDLGHAEGGERAIVEAEVGGPHNLDLAHGDAAGQLGQVLAEGGLEHQPFELAQQPVVGEPPGPAQHLAQGLHVGGIPGQPMSGELVRIDQTRIDPALDDRHQAQRSTRGVEQPLGGGQRGGAGGAGIGDRSAAAGGRLAHASRASSRVRRPGRLAWTSTAMLPGRCSLRRIFI